jgi:hypothetical protein
MGVVTKESLSNAVESGDPFVGSCFLKFHQDRLRNGLEKNRVLFITGKKMK